MANHIKQIIIKGILSIQFIKKKIVMFQAYVCLYDITIYIGKVLINRQ